MATISEQKSDDEDPLVEQARIIESLIRLASTLKDLDCTKSAPQLSHYRTIPEGVSQSYTMIYQGASLVHAASTKYTLLGKLDAGEQTKMCSDLLKGCQYIATGCLAIHDNVTGCSRSARHHARQAARSIVTTVIQLLESFVEHLAQPKESQIGAQKTGAVWQACDVIIEKKLPIGNRAAMKRDLLVYKMECNETLTEFQEMIDLGPSLKETNNDNEDEKTEETETPWELFLDGKDDQYSNADLEVAVACLGVIKCSRGCVNVALQAIEAVGQQIEEIKEEEKRKVCLCWISNLHDLSTVVGDGVTDLGASFYPPLNLSTLRQEIVRQSDAVESAIAMIIDAALSNGDSLELPVDVNQLASKIQSAVSIRRTEALDSIASVESK